MQPLSTIFFGTAEIACWTLRTLSTCPEIRLVGVVTQPDRPKGRDLKLQPSPVKTTALELSVQVLQPAKARDPSFIQAIRGLQPDLAVVLAYGQILPQALLDVPRLGCLNIHTSILPRHRGAAPIQWAILEGDLETGITIMKMDAGLDTGDILCVERTPIHTNDTAETLHDRLAQIGADLVVRTIPAYASGQVSPTKQPTTGVTYARKITREDGFVDWQQPAEILLRRLRAFTPWPGATTCLPSGATSKRIKILDLVPGEGPQAAPGTIIKAGKEGLLVATGSCPLLVTRLQPEGKRPMTTVEFLAGHPVRIGTVLSPPPTTHAQD